MWHGPVIRLLGTGHKIPFPNSVMSSFIYLSQFFFSSTGWLLIRSHMCVWMCQSPKPLLLGNDVQINSLTGYVLSHSKERKLITKNECIFKKWSKRKSRTMRNKGERKHVCVCVCVRELVYMCVQMCKYVCVNVCLWVCVWACVVKAFVELKTTQRRCYKACVNDYEHQLGDYPENIWSLNWKPVENSLTWSENLME